MPWIFIVHNQITKATIDQRSKVNAVRNIILASDLSNTVKAFFPEISSMIQVECYCGLRLAALLSDRRYSDAHMYLIVFYFLFQLSMYHVDQIASIIMYGKLTL